MAFGPKVINLDQKPNTIPTHIGLITRSNDQRKYQQFIDQFDPNNTYIIKMNISSNKSNDQHILTIIDINILKHYDHILIYY